MQYGVAAEATVYEAQYAPKIGRSITNSNEHRSLPPNLG